MTSCRRVLFIVTQDKGSMSLSYEQFKQKKRSNEMKIRKYRHIKKRKEKKLRNGHQLPPTLYMCWCAVKKKKKKPKR